jgi:two-component system, NarL family, invasion response regulator UvrY
MIRVSLVDDHNVVRSGLKNILTDESDITITGESSNSDEIIRKLSLNDSVIDIIILDFAMPGMNGLETLERIMEIRKDQKVLMLSMYDDKEFVLRALNAGAAGYLAKDYAYQELAAAIRKIYGGDIYLGKSLKFKFKVSKDITSNSSFFSDLDKNAT